MQATCAQQNATQNQFNNFCMNCSSKSYYFYYHFLFSFISQNRRVDEVNEIKIER